MLYPSEFIMSFEAQYPRIKHKVEFPDSLNKCPKVRARIIDSVELRGKLELLYTDSDHNTYDLINRTVTNENGRTQHLSPNGYSIILDKVYEAWGDNMSPRVFAFILQDLEDMKPYKVNAQLAVNRTKYEMLKAIALHSSWNKFCTEQSALFEMDYSEFEDFLINDLIPKKDEVKPEEAHTDIEEAIPTKTTKWGDVNPMRNADVGSSSAVSKLKAERGE